MINVPDLSVVVCCFNSKSRIEKTLVHLFNQQVPENHSFEIIIVDNNSTDGTADYIFQLNEQFNISKIKLKLVYEYQAGLNKARICGVKNSRAKLILFCDDDNWLNEFYIINSIKNFEVESSLGCLGGNGEAVFENEKPIWFESHKSGYAAYSISEVRLDITHLPYTVYGAGMVIRKDLFLQIIEDYKLFTNDRKGSKLSSGGDSEICLYVKLFGFKVIVDPELHFYHFIPMARTQWKYCRNLYKSFGNSNSLLQVYYYILSGSNKSFFSWYFKFWCFHLKKISKSIKRLYFFLIKDLPGEEYITIYETSFRIVFSSMYYFPLYYKHYLFVKSKFEKK
jgi:glycosyltransferase involved in cell wall biosynthesis